MRPTSMLAATFAKPGAPPPADDRGRPDLTSGDPAVVFARLFDDLAPRLQRYLARRIGSTAAEDLVSETFLIAFRRRAEYDPTRAQVQTWLYAIATNLLRRHAADENRELAKAARLGRHGEPVEFGHDAAVVEHLDAAARIGQLAGALQRLSAGDRDVLLLTAWAELDATEVGIVLGIPAGTVRSRLHRVRATLRRSANPLAPNGESS